MRTEITFEWIIDSNILEIVNHILLIFSVFFSKLAFNNFRVIGSMTMLVS